MIYSKKKNSLYFIFINLFFLPLFRCYILIWPLILEIKAWNIEKNLKKTINDHKKTINDHMVNIYINLNIDQNSINKIEINNTKKILKWPSEHKKVFCSILFCLSHILLISFDIII